jgi:hypothetical protein
MRRLRPILHRLKRLLRRRALEAEMNAELQAHIDGLTQRYVAAGLSLKEARYAAQREFGGVAQIKERARDQRRSVWVEQFVQDFRVGLRVLLKEKGFCLVATTVLALGICSVTTQFTIVNTALFNLLPFPQPERLMMVKLRAAGLVGRSLNTNIMPSDYRDFANEQRSFERLAGYITGGASWPVAVDGITRPAAVSAVEEGLFELLGVAPVLGRSFTVEDDRPQAEPTGGIVRHVLGKGVMQLAIGGAIGTLVVLVVGTMAYGRIAGFLYRVTPFDPLVYSAVWALLGGASMLACFIPARRAAQVDPMTALRAD